MLDMAILVKQIQVSGGMGTPDKVMGLQNMAQHVQQHIQLIAQDPNEKERVKRYMDQLGRLMNLVKAFAQRLQEAAQKTNGHAAPDPEAMAKIQTQQMQAQAKMENTRESHAQRTTQRQLQFEQEMRQRQQEHDLQMKTEARQSMIDMDIQAREAGLDIAKEKQKLEMKKKSEADKKDTEE